MSFESMAKVPRPTKIPGNREDVLNLRKWAKEYGQATRQLSVRAKLTKDNPGTLPISAYGRRTLDRNPLTTLEEMRQEILGSMPTTEATDEEENEVDINHTSVNFDGSDVVETEANMVLVKNSVILISQDDRVSGSFLLGSLAQDWRRNTMETVRTHVYAPDEEDCLLFHYEFSGLVRKANVVQEVDTENDKLMYLDDDFHMEISDDLYHECLDLVYDRDAAGTAATATEPARETSAGRVLRLPHRFRE